MFDRRKNAARPDSDFSGFHGDNKFLNLIAQPPGRECVSGQTFHVSDVDATYDRAVGLGLAPAAHRGMPSGASGTFT